MKDRIRWFPQQFEVECFGGSRCPLLRRTDKELRSRDAVSYSRDCAQISRGNCCSLNLSHKFL